jgi:hypothetical protein
MAAEWFGETTLGTSDAIGETRYNDNAITPQYTCPGVGLRQVTHMRVRTLGYSGNCRIAIYDTSLNLIAQTAEFAPTVNGWNPAGVGRPILGGPIYLTGGQNYLLAGTFEANTYYYYNSVTNGSKYFASEYTNDPGFPNPIGAGAASGKRLIIQAWVLDAVTTAPPTTIAPTTLAPTSPPTTIAPTTLTPPTTGAPTTEAPTPSPTTVALTTLSPTTVFDCEFLIEWDASPGATGYKVYFGNAPGVYNGPGSPIDVGNVLQYLLTVGFGIWYVAVTAYNGEGESGYSNEIILYCGVTTPPPTTIGPTTTPPTPVPTTTAPTTESPTEPPTTIGPTTVGVTTLGPTTLAPTVLPTTVLTTATPTTTLTTPPPPVVQLRGYNRQGQRLRYGWR